MIGEKKCWLILLKQVTTELQKLNGLQLGMNMFVLCVQRERRKCIVSSKLKKNLKVSFVNLVTQTIDADVCLLRLCKENRKDTILTKERALGNVSPDFTGNAHPFIWLKE